jgi:hypothetical protein
VQPKIYRIKDHSLKRLIALIDRVQISMQILDAKLAFLATRLVQYVEPFVRVE